MTTCSTVFAQRPYFDKNKDILIAQFDSKPDPDDIHAQAALGSMLLHNDLQGVNYYAVAGAYGQQGGIFIDSDALFDLAFGVGNWTDADADKTGSVIRIANKVVPILQNGGKVWVQEAGQSNITRDWLVEVLKTVNANTVKNNVIVVQHSEWNENHADNNSNSPASNPVILNFVKNNSQYFAIDDGNAPFGGFGNRGQWDTPQYRSRNQSFINNAITSPNIKARQIWIEAERAIAVRYPNGVPYNWSYMKNGGNDFSDCVENWWIFDIGSKADDVTKFWSRYVTNTAGSNSGPTLPCTNKTFEEKNGVAAIEAEDFIKQSKTNDREWFIIGSGGNSSTPNPDPDPGHQGAASGGKYIELLPDTRVTHSDPLVNGVSFSDAPGVAAVLDYRVKFNSPGKYFVWVRAYSTGSEDNGVHVGIDGTWPASGTKMQWCTGKNAWTWESKQRTNVNHCGVAQQIFIDVPTAGIHTISFSMREDGFEMDKFILSKAYTKPSGNGANPIVANCNTATSIPIPGTIQVENFSSKNGDVQVENTPGGDQNLGFIKNNNFTEYNIDVANAGSYKLDAFVSSDGVGGNIVVSVAGNNLATVAVPVNNDWHNYSIPVSVNLNLAAGTQDIRFTYTGPSGFLFNVDRAVLTLNTPISSADCSAAPANMAVSTATNTSVTVSYDNTTNDTRIFELRAFAAGTFNGNINATTVGYASGAAGSTSITMNNLQAGTTYDFVLRALCGAGSGPSPVAIISGTTSGGTTTTILSAIDDAFLQGSTSYNSSVLRTEKGKRVSYLKFDVSGINGTITGASLNLTVSGDPGNGNINVNVGNSNNWTEVNLSTANAPVAGALLGSLNKTYSLNQTETFTLNNIAVSGNFLTLVVTQTNGNDVSFASDESANGKPVLTINYNTPNGANTRSMDTNGSTTMALNEKNTEIHVFPNPTSDYITVSINEVNRGSSIEVYNINGSLITSKVAKSTETTIDISDLSTGLYILKLVKDDQILNATQVIKK